MTVLAVCFFDASAKECQWLEFFGRYGGGHGLAAPLIRGASERRQSEAIAGAKEQGRAG